MDMDVEFLTYVVKSIVNYPDEVRVERTVDDLGVLLTVQVHRDDMGRLIGREGSTAKALRTVLRVVGLKMESRVNMKILEPGEVGQPQPRDEYEYTPREKMSDREMLGM